MILEKNIKKEITNIIKIFKSCNIQKFIQITFIIPSMYIELPYSDMKSHTSFYWLKLYTAVITLNYATLIILH